MSGNPAEAKINFVLSRQAICFFQLHNKMPGLHGKKILQ
jgi:hypothetical protein